MPRKGVFPFVVADIKRFCDLSYNAEKSTVFRYSSTALFISPEKYSRATISAVMKFALSTLDTKQGSSGLFVFTSYQLNKCPLNFSSDNAASSVFSPCFCRFVVGDFKNACRHVGKYRKPDIRRRGIVLIIPFRQHGEIVGNKRIFWDMKYLYISFAWDKR